MKVKFLHIGFLLLLTCLTASAQSPRYFISASNAAPLATPEDLRYQVELLTDSLCTGRATGTVGSVRSQTVIGQLFKSAGLLPLEGSYYRGFRTTAGAKAHNVVGILPGSGDRYVIVGAHYDHIGTLSGALYPGADSNASGVSSLLTLARMFQHLKSLGKTYAHSIIFVAFDAKEQSLGGSFHLWNEIAGGRLTNPRTGQTITPNEIDRMVNIDQVGGTEAPLNKNRPDFLMMLSDEKTGRRDALLIANMSPEVSLDVAFDYYGSKDFTRVFYRSISDQKPFLDNGIPSVMFTSGITLRNNKTDDNTDSLNYEILRRRVLAIFYYLVRVI
ncbi:MAG: M28 family peptidase [Bacteroidales bacterium]|nr:M28 family peptidase [Bacteroidales bacterium]